MEILDAFYLDDNFESIKAQRKFIDGSREINTTVIINKFTENDTINPDWEYVIASYGEDKLKQRTIERNREINERNREAAKNNKLAKEGDRLRRLFSKKVEVFNLDWVKDCNDIEFKKSVRKASSELEVLLLTVKKYLEM